MALHRPRQAHPRHGFVESFNGRMRDERLNETPSFTIGQAREMLARRLENTNTKRPHSSLGYVTPAALAAGLDPQRPGLIPTVASPKLPHNNNPQSPVPAR